MKAHLRKLAVHVGGKMVRNSTRNRTLSANFAKLADGDDSPEVFSALADAFNQAAADDLETAGHCNELVQALDEYRKGAGFDGLDALMPSPVSAVTPDAPQSSLRPIFRSGQREFSVQKSDGDGKEDLAFETLKKITQIEHVEQVE